MAGGEPVPQAINSHAPHAYQECAILTALKAMTETAVVATVATTLRVSGMAHRR